MRRLVFSIFLLTLTNFVWAQDLAKSLIPNEETIVSDAYMAVNYALSGDHEKAIPLIEKFIGLQKIYCPEDVLNRAKFCQFLCNSYIQVGRLKEAEELYLTTLDELTQKSYKEEDVYRNLLMGLAVVYVNLQNYQVANTYIEFAKNHFENNLDFGDAYVQCLSTMAIIKLELGEKSFARMCIDCAVRQARLNFVDSTQMTEGMISVGQSVGIDVDDDIERKTNIMLKITPYITILSNASYIYQQMGYLGQAVQYIKEAIQVCEENDVPNAIAYNNMGCMYLSNFHFEDAIGYLEKGYTQVTTPSEYDEIAFNLALAKYLAKSTDISLFAAEVSYNIRQHVDDVFDYLSSDERAIFWKHFEFYLPLLNLMIYDSGDKSHYGDIYDNILKCKGLLLNTSNLIKDAIYASENVEDITNYEEILALRMRLSKTMDNKERINIDAKIAELDRQLTKNATAYAQFKEKNQVDWQLVRDCLDDKDIVIEFYNIPIIYLSDTIQNMDGEPRYCAAILRKEYNEPHIIPLCKESELINKDQDFFYDTDYTYSLIWKPLEQDLQGVNNIYFSADRELHKIAIEYALLPSGMRMNDVYNMYRLSSTRELAYDTKEKKIQKAVLYGGLNYDIDKDKLIAESRNFDYHETKAMRAIGLDDMRYGVKYLPGTKEEVEKISNSFEAAQINHTTIVGDAGTEESFRSLGKDINIIHLATHGFFWTSEQAEKRNYVNFLANTDKQQRQEDKALTRSGLFFSGANVGLKGEELPDDVEDGVLTALELSTMNLGDVDLVVLSACQSGLGEVSGEGVFGLQRGFKLAGANTLLMSLWKVDDTATQMLMSEFYCNLLAGQSKIASLNMAQQYLKSRPKYADPKYWAAFILLDAIN